MITKTEKNRLQKILKNDWLNEVIAELEEQEVTNRLGKPYSESMIRMVFTGKRENQEIEAAILKVYANRKSATQKANTEKKELLSA